MDDWQLGSKKRDKDSKIINQCQKETNNQQENEMTHLSDSCITND